MEQHRFEPGDRVVWAGEVYVEEPPGGRPAVVRPGDIGEVVVVEPDGVLGRLQRLLSRGPHPTGLTVTFPETGMFGCLDTQIRHADE